MAQKTKRKSISKKTRFEVFKRDSFTCQYCGSKAPDVVLEVDHIEPVSEGGTDDLINLVTACFDCNRGKSNRRLSDQAVVQQQREELEARNERRIQLEMIARWRKEMAEVDNLCVDTMIEAVGGYGISVYQEELQMIKKWVKQFNIGTLLESVDRAFTYYDNIWEAFIMIPRIAYCETHPDKKQESEIRYIAGIVRNRFFGSSHAEDAETLEFLTTAANYLATDRLKELALSCDTWTDFEESITTTSKISGGIDDGATD